MRRSKKISKLCVTGLWEGNPPVTGGFPSQRASNAENISICWRHHVWTVLWWMVALLFHVILQNVGIYLEDSSFSYGNDLVCMMGKIIKSRLSTEHVLMLVIFNYIVWHSSTGVVFVTAVIVATAYVMALMTGNNRETGFKMVNSYMENSLKP